MDLSELVTELRAAMPAVLIATDFDGTLAAIGADPAESRPLPGAVEALRRLAEAGAQVAVITGRDAETVVRIGGLDAVPGIRVLGLYGVETWQNGQLNTIDEPEAISLLRARLPGFVAANARDERVWIEDKRLSLVVHTRPAADPDAELSRLGGPAEALAAELGLELHRGRYVLEFRMTGFDKGSGLRTLVEDCRPQAVLYLGDDVGDLPAFAAVSVLRAGGLSAYGVAVVSSETDQVGPAADAIVDDPPAAVDLLVALSA